MACVLVEEKKRHLIPRGAPSFGIWFRKCALWTQYVICHKDQQEIESFEWRPLKSRRVIHFERGHIGRLLEVATTFHPLASPCKAKGAEMTSLWGGEPFAPLPAGFRCLLWPPLPEHHQLLCLVTCVCNQLHGLCHKKGFFHGMICVATTDPLRQGSDLR